MPKLRSLLLVFSFTLLTGCDQLGIELPAQTTARLEAEGRAIGGACRQAGRALEDCYQINPRVTKAAIFNGWRDMDAYMRDNKLDVIKPEYPLVPPGVAREARREAAAEQAGRSDPTQATRRN